MSEHICTNCNKKYANKTTLNNHLQKCKGSKTQIESVLEELEQYKKLYKEKQLELDVLKIENKYLKKIEDRYHNLFKLSAKM